MVSLRDPNTIDKITGSEKPVEFLTRMLALIARCEHAGFGPESLLLLFESCRERGLWRSWQRKTALIRSSRNARDGVPYGSLPVCGGTRTVGLPSFVTNRG